MGLCERSKARPQDVGGGEGVQIWTVAVADHRQGMVLQLGSLGEGIAIFHPKKFCYEILCVLGLGTDSLKGLNDGIWLET